MGKKSAAPVEAGMVEVRVLRDCAYGSAGDIVTVSEDEARNGLAAAMLDPDPAAIAYAKSLGSEE